MDRTIRNRRTLRVAVAVLLGGSLAVPAAAAAATGGAGLSSPTGHRTHKKKAHSSASQAPAPPATTTVTQPGNARVTATGNGITVQARESALLRRRLTFTGTAPGDAGKTIEIERNGHQTAYAWAPTASATVQPGGSFSVTWKTNHIGRFSIRAVVESKLAEPAASTGSMALTVYLPSVASWYGPTLYGNGTACGEKLTKHILGVANKTLPCGEDVALYYHGRTMVVPVIDRGPYIKGRRYDLTFATAKALGTVSAGVATIGAVSLPTAP
jgi:rare lipoprotein A